MGATVRIFLQTHATRADQIVIPSDEDVSPFERMLLLTVEGQVSRTAEVPQSAGRCRGVMRGRDSLTQTPRRGRTARLPVGGWRSVAR